MKIALAAPPMPGSLQEGIALLKSMTAEAAEAKAEILCFPESFLPGYPGMGYQRQDQSPGALKEALDVAKKVAASNAIALVLPMDGYIKGAFMNLAYVIDATGDILGYQTKNQLDPSEDAYWQAGSERNIFRVGHLNFGISICHEGFRYPESVRYCAVKGADLVFHPHFNGSNEKGIVYGQFMAPENPYYEKAMMMRALENGIYFASVNYCSAFPQSASAVFDPEGNCTAHLPYRVSGLLVVDIHPEKATRVYANRFKPGNLTY
jgi:predicted amidohydrolase